MWNDVLMMLGPPPAQTVPNISRFDELALWLANNWGNVASVLGLIVAIIGFWIAIATLRKTKAAAEAAQNAAEGARIQIYTVDIVTVCTDILSRFEEIKGLHRDRAMRQLPSRYSETRTLITTASVVGQRLSLEIPEAFSSAVNALELYENRIDIFLQKGVQPDFVKFNRELIGYGRTIRIFVEELKARRAGEEING